EILRRIMRINQPKRMSITHKRTINYQLPQIQNTPRIIIDEMQIHSHSGNPLGQAIYNPAEKIKKTYGISTSTLRRWNDKGDVLCITMPGGKRLYSTEDIDNIFVSNENKKDDLERQCAYLTSEFPDHKIITDIGSGNIEKVVITRKDRLCRFAYELVEWIFSKHEVKLMVLNTDVGSNNPDTGELAEDLLSIIRIYSTIQEKEKLMKWMNTARWTYKKALELIKNGEVRIKKNLRQKCINNENFRYENTWVLETPYDIRNDILIDLLDAYNSNFKSKRKKFNIRYKSKKDKQYSITIQSREWNRKRGNYAFLKKIRTSEQLLEINNAVNLVCDKFKRFYICIPIPIEEQYHENDDFISIDPGIRTFMTGYDPKGKIFEWGKGDISHIYRLCKRYDKYQNERSMLKSGYYKHKRYTLKRKMLKIYDKIKNLIKNCHHKIVKELCENYNTILLPRFETQNMIRKKTRLENQESTKKNFKRKIRNKTARMMLTMSHYKFQQHIIHKIREYPRRLLILCDEHYTSKTCGCCGYIKNNLGSAKKFKCDKCGFEIDRDHNGARNILLRHLSQGDLTLGPTLLE
ncbi:10009_t:CDS:2, partial [Cetraspora pellucida]